MPLLNRHIIGLDDQVEVVATMAIDDLWNRMLGEFLGEWSRLNRQGLSGEAMDAELRAFIDNLSDKPLKELARTSTTVAHNQGRGASLLGAAEENEARFVVRSEVLDQNTCAECAAIDGAIFEIGTPDFHAFMPPAKCLGGDRCRGFYIPIAGEA